MPTCPMFVEVELQTAQRRMIAFTKSDAGPIALLQRCSPRVHVGRSDAAPRRLHDRQAARARDDSRSAART